VPDKRGLPGTIDTPMVADMLEGQADAMAEHARSFIDFSPSVCAYVQLQQHEGADGCDAAYR
jgi:hypothetical protein